jgi:Predicted hydrolases or acyltransferases (alpha/beta hydrolase superfamily)
MENKKIAGILYSSDKVPIAYEHSKKGSDTVVIVCPGFFNSKKNRWMRNIWNAVSTKYDTVIFDFRGHGESGGKFTWSAKEHFDLEAVLNHVKKCGYKRIGILAFSLGAAASAIIGGRRDDIDSMVLISCPMSFWRINYHFWEPGMWSDLKDNMECEWEGKGARVASLLIPKPKPIENIAKIKNTPILFIHGDKDWVIKDSHSKKLYEAAKTHKRLEIIKKGLHAERLIQQYPEKMKDLIGGWFADTLDN